MGLNRGFLGKQYAPQDYGVTAEAMMRYARAYNDDNPWFVDTSRSGGIIAPPMFGVVTGWLSIMMVMTDNDLGVDVLGGIEHTLAHIAGLVAIAQLHRFAAPGRCAGRNRRAPHHARLEQDIALDCGIAARIENLARDYIDD